MRRAQHVAVATRRVATRLLTTHEGRSDGRLSNACHELLAAVDASYEIAKPRARKRRGLASENLDKIR